MSLNEDEDSKGVDLEEPKDFLSFRQVLFAAIVGSSGYFITYSFEYGFLSYFSIPLSLIDIHLTTVIIVVFTTFLLCLFLLNASSLLSIRGNFGVVTKTGFVVMIIIMSLASFVSPVFRGIYINLTFGEFFIGIFFIFISALLLILFPHAKNLDGVLGAVSSEFFHRRDGQVLFAKAIGLRLSVLLVVLMAVCCFAFSVGRSEAASKEQYFLVVGDVDEVVLRVYPDRYIAIPRTDVGTGRISKIIVRSTTGVIFEKRTVGTLNVDGLTTIEDVFRRGFIAAYVFSRIL